MKAIQLHNVNIDVTGSRPKDGNGTMIKNRPWTKRDQLSPRKRSERVVEPKTGRAKLCFRDVSSPWPNNLVSYARLCSSSAPPPSSPTIADTITDDHRLLPRTATLLTTARPATRGRQVTACFLRGLIRMESSNNSRATHTQQHKRAKGSKVVDKETDFPQLNEVCLLRGSTGRYSCFVPQKRLQNNKYCGKYTRTDAAELRPQMSSRMLPLTRKNLAAIPAKAFYAKEYDEALAQLVNESECNKSAKGLSVEGRSFNHSENPGPPKRRKLDSKRRKSKEKNLSLRLRNNPN